MTSLVKQIILPCLDLTIHAGEGADQLLQVVLHCVDRPAEHQACHEGQHEPPAPLGQKTWQNQHHSAPGPPVKWTDNKQASPDGSTDACSYVVTGHLSHNRSEFWLININPRSSSFSLIPCNFVSYFLLVNKLVWVEATAATGVSIMACVARNVARVLIIIFCEWCPSKKEVGDIKIDEDAIDRPQHKAHPPGTQEKLHGLVQGPC